MPELTDRDLDRIEAWDKDQTADIQLHIVSGGNLRDQGLETFCRALAAKAPRVSVNSVEDAHSGVPEIRVSPEIVYSAVPKGRELPPFLEALSLATGKPSLVPDSIRQGINSLETPVDLKLYIALECPHCPRMVQSLLPLAALGDRIRLHVIDGTLFPEEAERDQVMSVPTLILDRRTRWTGEVSVEEIVDAMAGREPGDLSSASFRRILEDGKASWIAGKMMEKNSLFPGFMELLVHGLWSVRLGALVVLEEIAEEAPRLAEGIAPFLIEKFTDADVTLKGDILYALGVAGDAAVRDYILSLEGSLEHEDLKEAARDAVDAISSRT